MLYIMQILSIKNSDNLAKRVAEKMSLSFLESNVKRFRNGESFVSLRQSSEKLLNSEVVIIACAETNDDWIELFLLLDALRGTKKMILCMSYMGYSRQDKGHQFESFAACLFPRLLQTMNIAKLMVVDAHSTLSIDTIQYLSAVRIFKEDILMKYHPDQIVIVSPDAGGIGRASELSMLIGSKYVFCSKVRSESGILETMNFQENIKGKICILVDDIVDSGCTLCTAARKLMIAGGRSVSAYCTHGVLSDGAIELLRHSNITEIVLTDSIQKDSILSPKIRKLSIDSLIVDEIRCML
jgi:ribose-phosphate pyrophosphokinase